MTTNQLPFEPCVKDKGVRVWKFVHHGDFEIQVDFLKGRSCDYNWMKITPDGTLTVKSHGDRGFAWDGCTPKWNFADFTFGTPDGKLIKFGPGDYKPITYYASMVHDVIYQYKACVPITRKEADKLFFQMLREKQFMFRVVYYAVVRMGGGGFGKWKYKNKSEIGEGGL